MPTCTVVRTLCSFTLYAITNQHFLYIHTAILTHTKAKCTTCAQCMQVCYILCIYLCTVRTNSATVLLNSCSVYESKPCPYSHSRQRALPIHTEPRVHTLSTSYALHLVPTLLIKEHPNFSIPLFLQDRVVARAFSLVIATATEGSNRG